MFRVNLLPPTEQKEFKWMNFSRLVLIHLGWLMAAAIISICLFANIYLFFQILLTTQRGLVRSQRKGDQISQLTEIERKIMAGNEQIKQISAKQEEIIAWTLVFEELSEITPAGVYLKNFSYQPQNNQVILNGQASSRDKLLVFQGILEESPYFEEVQSPLSNLIKQSNIDFTFDMKLSKEK